MDRDGASLSRRPGSSSGGQNGYRDSASCLSPAHGTMPLLVCEKSRLAHAFDRLSVHVVEVLIITAPTVAVGIAVVN